MEARNVYQRIADISKEMSAIAKTKKNVQQNFMFRGIDDVYNHLQPLLAKHEVFTVPTVLDERTEERQTKSGGTLIYRILKVEYKMYAPDSSYVRGVVTGEGMDSGDKAGNKAMSVAHKYFILQTFCIPTEDMKDPEAESVELVDKFITPEQAKEISKLIAETDSNNEKFWKFAGVENVDLKKAEEAMPKIPSKNYDQIVGMLNKKKQEQNKTEKKDGK
jgi:hypothetical protein